MQGLAAALAADADPVLVQALAQPPEHPHAVSWAAAPQVFYLLIPPAARAKHTQHQHALLACINELNSGWVLLPMSAETGAVGMQSDQASLDALLAGATAIIPWCCRRTSCTTERCSRGRTVVLPVLNAGHAARALGGGRRGPLKVASAR